MVENDSNMTKDFERLMKKHFEVYSNLTEVAEQIAAVRKHWAKLTQEEKNEFLEEWRKSEARRFQVEVQASGVFKKATDDDLRDASKFIAESNLSKLATKYLGLTSQQILGRDVFSVLKLWRDAILYQGSKQVRVQITEPRPTESSSFFSLT